MSWEGAGCAPQPCAQSIPAPPHPAAPRARASLVTLSRQPNAPRPLGTLTRYLTSSRFQCNISENVFADNLEKIHKINQDRCEARGLYNSNVSQTGVKSTPKCIYTSSVMLTLNATVLYCRCRGWERCPTSCQRYVPIFVICHLYFSQYQFY